jgi:preprotein translocase subunit SecG
MTELNPLTIILIINSIILITLTLTQNETSKDSANTQSSSASNPFETLTWIFLVFQLIFLLIKQKITDF